VVRDIELPHTKYAIASYYLIATAEAVRTWRATTASATARARSKRRRSVRCIASRAARDLARGKVAHHARNLRLSAGYYDAYYKKAQQVRTLISRDFEQAFKNVDLIVGPPRLHPPSS